MARYTKITIEMWDDDKFQKLSRPKPNGQSLWQYLLTGRHKTVLPCAFVAREASLAECLGWPLAGFRKAFQEIEGLGMASADWSKRLVFLPRGLQHNPPQSPKVVKAWRKAFDDFPECTLKLRIFETTVQYLEEAFDDGEFIKAFGKGYTKDFHEVFREGLPKGFHEDYAKGNAEGFAEAIFPLPQSPSPFNSSSSSNNNISSNSNTVRPVSSQSSTGEAPENANGNGRTDERNNNKTGTEDLQKLWAPVEGFIRKLISAEAFYDRFAGCQILKFDHECVTLAVPAKLIAAYEGSPERTASNMRDVIEMAKTGLMRDRALKVVSLNEFKGLIMIALTDAEVQERWFNAVRALMRDNERFPGEEDVARAQMLDLETNHRYPVMKYRRDIVPEALKYNH